MRDIAEAELMFIHLIWQPFIVLACHLLGVTQPGLGPAKNMGGKMRHPILAAVAAAFLLGTVSAAHAVATLSLSANGGAATFSCADGAACDTGVAGDGVVNFNGMLGAFVVNVTTGITKPTLTGVPPFGLMDLNTVNVLSANGGQLEIMFSDTGFMQAGQLFGDFGGTLTSASGSTITGLAYFDAANVLSDAVTGLSGTATEFCGIGPFGPGAFSGSCALQPTPSAPYSLTTVFQLNMTSAGSFSGDFAVRIPEPTTLALLGLGFAFAGFWSRRRQLAAG